MTAFLSGLAYRLGERTPIEQLPELRGDPGLLADLRANGLAHYCSAEGDRFGLLVGAVEASLARAGRAAKEVDAVVVCSGTTTWTLDHEGTVFRALAAVGIEGVPCVGVTMYEAANANVAVANAAAMVAAGAEAVLVAAVDAVPVGDSRVTPPDVAVASDGAVAGIVGPDEGDWLVRGWANGWDAALSERPLGPDTLDDYAAFQLAGLARACQEAADVTGVAQSDLRAVVVPNLARPLLEAAAAAVGLTPEQVPLDNVARNGHVQAADVLVNLADLERVAAGDIVVPFAVGRYTWSAATLQAVAR